MKSWLAGVGVGAVLGVGLIGASSVSWTGATAQDSRAETYGKLDIFGDILSRVQSDYVTEIDDAEAIEAAINGMLTSLDPHSGYLNPEDFRDIQVDTSGEYGGLGIEVLPEDGFVKVVAPIDDTPASRAGLKSGDLLTAINGRQIVGLPLNDAVKEMRGVVGTDITITVLREGMDPFDVTLTREVIRPKSVRWEMKEGDIGYVRISSFNDLTTELLEDALAEISRESSGTPEGLVLDLRNNPGGLLDQAISVSELFLSGGEVVSTFGRHSFNDKRYPANKEQVFKGVPMIVIINSGSASAAEIVAGALQDRERARILGITSFGKGSVQTVIPLGAERGALRLTTARYYTPSGRSIQGTGIDPDIEVAAERVTEEELERIRLFSSEADLPNALANEDGSERRGPHIPADQPPEGYDKDGDYQLDRALDILRDPAKFASIVGRAG